MTRAPFSGFAASDLAFLTGLAAHNDREWFTAHRAVYDERLKPKLSPGLVYVHIEPEGGPAPAFDPETIDPLDPSTLPSAQEEQAGYAGSGPFAAAGFYLSERPHIDAFRRAIAADPRGWLAVEKALAAKGLPLEPGEPTKRMPKGFEDHAGTALEPGLKRTRWLVRRSLTGAEIGDGE